MGRGGRWIKDFTVTGVDSNWISPVVHNKLELSAFVIFIIFNTYY